MKKLLAMVLTLVMVFSMIPSAFATNEAEFTPGLVIEKASDANLNGDFGDAYAAAGYQATFTYIAGEDEDVDHIDIWGDFQWYSDEGAQEFVDNGFTGKVTGYSAYQYRKGYIVAGFGSPMPTVTAEENVYGVEGLYSNSYIYYPMIEVADGVFQLTMPIPAGQYRYAYKLYNSEGNAKQVCDPSENVNWYVIETMNEIPAYWSYFLVGTADEASQNQEYIFPTVAEDKQGTVYTDEVECITGSMQRLQVYVPYNYDKDRIEPYKVIFTSHGGSENETVYMTLGSVPTIMDNLIAEGSVSDDVIVVTMDNGTTFQNSNFGDRLLTAQNVVEILVPYIAENYNASTDSEDIAICGSSSGGELVLKALQYLTDEFAAFGLFSCRNTQVTDLTDDQIAAIVDANNEGRIYFGGGLIESVRRKGDNYMTLDERFASIGCPDLVFDAVPGAHDFFTWHQTYVKFVKSLNWTDDGANIAADSVIAKCGEGETASINVTYNNEVPGTSVRVKIDTELDIKSIDSDFSYEFNPESNYILVYTDSEINNGDLLFTMNFDFGATPWLADGSYRIGLEVVEATNNIPEIIELNGYAGYIIIKNEYETGDINRDGIFNNADLVTLARYLVDLEQFDDQQLLIADFDGDGKVGNIDLIKIARVLVVA